MEEKLPEEVEPEAEEQSEFDLSYAKDIAAIPPAVRVIMEKVAHKIKVDGVTIDEACLLCNIEPDWLSARIEEHPVIARALAKKDLEYRVNLMKPINKKAKIDDKAAQYLLELRTPKQRKNAVGMSPDDSGDMLALAIGHIQEHGDSSPLVRRESGAAILSTSATSSTRLMNKIKGLLPKGALS